MHSRLSKAAFAFDPALYREALCQVIREIEAAAAAQGGAQAALPRAVLDGILRRYPRDGRGFFSRSELIAGYRAFAGSEGFGLGEAGFVARVQMRPVRTQSGVTPVTVLTKPFPCPGQCVFCPNDVRMPKSYLSAEPGCQRAEANGFDPYLQTYQRLRAFHAIGHPTDKAELIVLGGTFSYYPESYRRWFIKRCFDAFNDFAVGRDGCEEAQAHSLSVAALRENVDGAQLGQLRATTYNRVVSQFLREREHGSLTAAYEHASWDELHAAQLANERSRVRNVGLVLETRPDHIDWAEIVRLRRLGCTKVQLGYQSLSDEVLSANKRGHDVAAIRRATGMLRASGFKILAHLMPNLLGATPASDLADIAQLFDDPDFRPDELKLYPCSLIETAELMRFYREGQYQPYAHDELLAVVCEALRRAPRYCRLARVIRDISSGDIVAGNRVSNLREVAERKLRAEGSALQDIRSREIKRRTLGEPQLRVTAYDTSVSQERFIELTTDDDALLGFCRLSLPKAEAPLTAAGLPELRGSALIRELHVYGASLALGQAPGGDAQHRGYGTRLLREAAALAAAHGFSNLAVISAVGTRPYYRARGFVNGELYQHLPLADVGADKI
jgi:elongator complex protein 3